MKIFTFALVTVLSLAAVGCEENVHTDVGADKVGLGACRAALDPAQQETCKRNAAERQAILRQ